jgi:predicted kinase
MNKRIAYIFRGAPASGKGTLTKEFMKRLPGKIAYLELDALRWGFHLINRDIHEIEDEEHQLSYQNFLSLLENYCRNGKYTIVVEGLFSWDVPSPHGNIQDILSLLDHYQYEAKLLYLQADYDTLWERNTKRDYQVPKEEFDSLHNHVTQKIGDSEIIIDVQNNTIEECLEILEKHIESSF